MAASFPKLFEVLTDPFELMNLILP